MENQENMRNEANGPSTMPNEVKKMSSEDPFSYVAAYDTNGSWEWAKNTNGSYYVMDGEWVKTRAGWVFATVNSAEDIIAACQKGLGNRTFAQAYAAMSSTGSNYTIVPKEWFNKLYH